MPITRPRASQIRGLAIQQPPFLADLIPDSNLPNSRGDYILRGAFFSPNMTIEFTGNQTIHYINFIDDNEVRVNMTLGPDEGLFGVTLNNGIESYFSNALLVVLGDVFKPSEADWNPNPEYLDISKAGEARILATGLDNITTYSKKIDFTKDWRLTYSFELSPITLNTNLVTKRTIEIKSVVDGTTKMWHGKSASNNSAGYGYLNMFGAVAAGASDPWSIPPLIYTIERINGVFKYYKGDNLAYTYNGSEVQDEDWELVINPYDYDVTNIQYIELAT